MIVCAWAAPALNKPNNLPSDLGVIAINICPIPMCMQIQQPCANIQTSYITMNGKKCPMCQYCATPTVEQPENSN
ncbi:unnamed protein product [Rotaria sp. Silwood1]|nr:unnamed protein product [Rotaria sp. Silwood1]CAF4535852.1 unnamed protein product [Rotaria sp. Silwood1]CAF4560413.1 unnamed protein product [Rotaria sp. Silwood1]